MSNFIPRRTDIEKVRGYYLKAMHLAKLYAQKASKGTYKFRGDSCYVINQMALSAILLARHGKLKPHWIVPLDPGDDPNCEALAGADHYLDLRTRFSLHGAGYGANIVGGALVTTGYDAVKLGTLGLELSPGPVERALGGYIERKLREDDNRPLSAPSVLVEGAAYSGMLAGISDNWNNDTAKFKADNSPAWFVELYKAGKTFKI